MQPEHVGASTIHPFFSYFPIHSGGRWHPISRNNTVTPLYFSSSIFIVLQGWMGTSCIDANFKKSATYI